MAIQDMLFNLILVFFTTAVGVAVKMLRDYLKREGKTEALRIVEILAHHAVQATEQILKDTDIHGQAKLDHAKDMMLHALKERGMNVTDDDLTLLIESAVGRANEVWKSVE